MRDCGAFLARWALISQLVFIGKGLDAAAGLDEGLLSLFLPSSVIWIMSILVGAKNAVTNDSAPSSTHRPSRTASSAACCRHELTSKTGFAPLMNISGSQPLHSSQSRRNAPERAGRTMHRFWCSGITFRASRLRACSPIMVRNYQHELIDSQLGHRINHVAAPRTSCKDTVTSYQIVTS